MIEMKMKDIQRNGGDSGRRDGVLYQQEVGQGLSEKAHAAAKKALQVMVGVESRVYAKVTESLEQDNLQSQCCDNSCSV